MMFMKKMASESNLKAHEDKENTVTPVHLRAAKKVFIELTHTLFLSSLADELNCSVYLAFTHYQYDITCLIPKKHPSS